MIELPETYQDQAYMDQSNNRLILLYQNDAREYFLWMYHFDPAYTWEEHMTRIENEVKSQFPGKQAIKLGDDLSTTFVDPADQNWHPAYIPVEHIVSFAQFKAHAKILQEEEKRSSAT